MAFCNETCHKKNKNLTNCCLNFIRYAEGRKMESKQRLFQVQMSHFIPTEVTIHMYWNIHIHIYQWTFIFWTFESYIIRLVTVLLCYAASSLNKNIVYKFTKMISYITKHLMTDPSGNQLVLFPSNLNGGPLGKQN